MASPRPFAVRLVGPDREVAPEPPAGTGPEGASQPRVGTEPLLASEPLVALRVRTASSVWARFRGLMGRRSLDDGEGLWFPGDTSIHMLFMRFPIDALFLAPDVEPGVWRVVAVRSHLPPWRGVVWFVRGAKGCLEVAAGRAAAAGASPGTRLRFDPS